MKNVIITDYLPPPPDIEQEALDGLARVHCLQAHKNSDLRGRLHEADGIILFHEVTMPAEIIAEASRCQIIVRCGVGFDSVDLKAAGAQGTAVSNVPDYGVDEVADHAIALMLACVRGLMRVERGVRWTLQPWDKRAVGFVPRLAGMTLGIIGLGRIGSATALRAKAFKMRVLACDPYARAGTDKVLGVQLVDLATLLSESDVVSIHTPLTEETRNLINASALSQMKPTAILINTSRGAVVDAAALAETLRNGRLAGAGLDVLPVEPPAADDSLIQLWRQTEQRFVNLVLTPHTAFYSEAGIIEMRLKAAQEIGRAFRGERLSNCVNTEHLRR